MTKKTRKKFKCIATELKCLRDAQLLDYQQFCQFRLYANEKLTEMEKENSKLSADVGTLTVNLEKALDGINEFAKIKEKVEHHNVRLNIASSNRFKLRTEFRKFRRNANDKFTALKEEIDELRASNASHSAYTLKSSNEINQSVFDLNGRLQKEIDAVKEADKNNKTYLEDIRKDIRALGKVAGENSLLISGMVNDNERISELAHGTHRALDIVSDGLHKQMHKLDVRVDRMEAVNDD